MEDENEPPPPERLSPATADNLADFATALLAAPNLDVNAVGRMGRVHESAKNADLNAPYKGLVPYKGRCGAEGKFLFCFFRMRNCTDVVFCFFYRNRVVLSVVRRH